MRKGRWQQTLDLKHSLGVQQTLDLQPNLGFASGVAAELQLMC
jgi:hypothetical protein